jgi:hypothetical protein
MDMDSHRIYAGMCTHTKQDMRGLHNKLLYPIYRYVQVLCDLHAIMSDKNYNLIECLSALDRIH